MDLVLGRMVFLGFFEIFLVLGLKYVGEGSDMRQVRFFNYLSFD